MLGGIERLFMLKKVYRILDSHQKSRICILLIMILGGALFETLGVSAILPLVSAVTNPSIIHTNDNYRKVYELVKAPDEKSFILYMAIALVFVYIIKNIYLILLNMAQNHFTTNNERRMAVKLVKRYMDQDYLFHVNHNIAELHRNVSTDVALFVMVITNVLMLITESLVCLMLAFFLLITDFYTTLLLISMWGIFLLLFIKAVKKRLRELGELRRVYSKEIEKTFLEAFGGIKEVKAINKESYFASRYDNAHAGYAMATQKEMLLSYMPKPLMESLFIGGLLLFLAIRIYLGADVSKFIPVMSVFAIAAIRMLPSFSRISGYIGAIMLNRASVDALYEDLQEISGLKDEKKVNKDIEVTIGDICVKDVTFAYPSKPDVKILESVNLVIPQNKSVAFVGPSGAGKTTLADVILGILKPQSGKVEVNGIDVIENEKAWHEHIGYIPQSIFLIDDTVRANVAFGIPENEIDDERVWEVLEEAQLSEFFKNQKSGIYTPIGDRGVLLSGGQRQRIGIARALYANPEVIVLDEATSALDNDTERAVMDAIYRLSGRKTMIIIAHRLSTIVNCDIVCEVSGGKVVIKK